MRRFFASFVVAFSFLGGLANADTVGRNGDTTFPLLSAYDLAATSYIYCQTLGLNNKALGEWKQADGRITTSGSSTTTTATDTTGTAPFTQLSVGDELLVNLGGVQTYRYVTAKASSTSITVNTAWDLSATPNGAQGAGYFLMYRNRSCGTSATSGYYPVTSLTALTFQIDITTMSATSIDADLECYLDGAVTNAAQVWTKNYTAASNDIVTLDMHVGRYDQCRFGLKVNTDTGTQSISVKMAIR